MGADQSCPCNGDSNVYFPPEDGEDGDAIVVARKVPSSPTAEKSSSLSATSLEKTPITKGKSRKWAAQPKDASVDVSATSTQQVSCVFFCFSTPAAVLENCSTDDTYNSKL